MVRFSLLLVLTMGTGCATFNQLEHKQVNRDTFLIKQSVNSNILCVKANDNVQCFYVDGDTDGK